MPMTANGLAKLAEECGELLQVIGKRLAYYHTDEHPDGGPPLPRRLEDEIADVIAAATFVVQNNRLDISRINQRIKEKSLLFTGWHGQADNNQHGVDR